MALRIDFSGVAGASALSLSAVAAVADRLFVASDEGAALILPEKSGDGFGRAQAIDFRDRFAAPGAWRDGSTGIVVPAALDLT